MATRIGLAPVHSIRGKSGNSHWICAADPQHGRYLTAACLFRTPWQQGGAGEDLAKDVGISIQTLVDTHDQRYQASQKTTKDLDGGSYKAYPSNSSGPLWKYLAS